MAPSNKAAFLDRDGTINRAVVRAGRPYPPDSLAEFQFLPGALEGISLLKEAGYLVIVVTNQPDVARGTQSREVVDQMHRVLRESAPIDDIKACFEEDSPACTCYKPKPGMLLAAAKQHDIDLRKSIMIGDRWRDVGAGINAGCTTYFIDHNYEEALDVQPSKVVSSLLEAAKHIISKLEFE